MKLLSLAAVLLLPWSPAAAQPPGFERPPIDYMNAPVTDPVANLIQRMDSGETHLRYDAQFGYLPSLLEQLSIPQSSQTLVFSKTSLQLHRITPRRPRALYFNDEVYVGWCQRGDFIEIASTDADQGAIFYTIDQSSPKSIRREPSTSEAPPEAAVEILRDRGQCLTCHASSRTQNVPGYLVRSVFTEASGQPQFGNGTYTTSHRSDFKRRWGGWYVTGEHGAMRHMGNEFARTDRGGGDFDFETGANLRDLQDHFMVDRYLTPHSDIVALMVLDHQTQMHNAITAANFETRQALHQSFQMNEILDREPEFVSESARRRITRVATNLVDHLLFKDEYRLTDRVRGTSSFAEEFVRLGPFDSQGRSLREFDLRTRLFRFPCSYLIYSPSFDALPDAVRRRVWERLSEILSQPEECLGEYQIDEPERIGILAILTATKAEFKQYRTAAEHSR